MPFAHLRLALGETIHCPSCGHAFALSDGLKASVLQRLEREQAASEKHLRDQIAAEERRKTDRATASAATAHAKALAAAKAEAEFAISQVEAERDTARRQLDDAVAKALAASKTQHEGDLAALRRLMTEQDHAREEQLRAHRESELALRKELLAADQARANAELAARRQLDKDRAKIRADAMKEQQERDRRALADAEQKLAEARAANDDLNRKLQQGSQQAQGEAGELDVQRHLEATFRLDTIESVPAGVKGADFIQHVRTPDGQDAGCIVWEVKVTAKFRPAWLEKLKADSLKLGARLSVLVTSALPPGCDRPFFVHDNILIVADSLFKPFAELAREFVLRQHLHAQLAKTSDDQMARLLDYALRGALPQRLNNALMSLHTLSTEHQKEANYFMQHHAKRATLIKATADSLQSIKGELSAILRDPEADRRFALPEADGGPLLEADSAHPDDDTR